MMRFRGNARPAAVLSCWAVALAWGMFGGTSGLFAGQVTLKIRAINPSTNRTQSVQVMAILPHPAKAEDVISAGELDVTFNVSSNAYAVQKKIEMEPGQTRTFDVVLKDVWVIPRETLAAIETQAKDLAAALKGSAKQETAAKLSALIQESVKAVSDRQAAHAIGSVKPVDHIRAFEMNQEGLQRARRDLGLLENLAVSAGKNPKQIIGAPQASPPAGQESGSATGDVIILNLQITNPATNKQSASIRRDLPMEVRSTDVLDAGGLQIGFDAGRNICYAFADAIELEPRETRKIALRLRDPWADIPLRIPRLKARAGELAKLTADRPDNKAVEEQARGILKELTEAGEQSRPAARNEQYVAFARRQAETLRGIEGRIMRLEELFQPREKPIPFGGPVMNVPRPDRKTTWIIIYIVLGFLALFSVLFFLRWYGRTKAEKLDRNTAREGGAGAPAPR